MPVTTMKTGGKMKINRGNIENIYSRAIIDAPDKRTGIETNTAEANTEKDKVQISDKAREYAAGKSFAMSVIKEVSEQTRPEKLTKLKNDIACGSYNIPGDKIAAAILGKLR